MTLLRLLTLLAFLLHHCSGFCLFSHLAGLRRVVPQVTRKQYLVNRLERMRSVRGDIKAEILKTIQLQRMYKENSREFLELERNFLELLQKEDNIILEMEGVVKQLTRTKTLSRSVCSVYKSYMNEG